MLDVDPDPDSGLLSEEFEFGWNFLHQKALEVIVIIHRYGIIRYSFNI
jgi:hypothetical protein